MGINRENLKIELWNFPTRLTSSGFFIRGRFKRCNRSRRSVDLAGVCSFFRKWINTPLSQAQSQTFRISFDATPSAINIDAVKGKRD